MRVSLIAIVMAFACNGSAPAAGGGDGTTTSGTGGTSGGTNPTSTTTATGESSGASSSGTSTSTNGDDGPPPSDTGRAFLDEPDVGGWACDLWAHDCPAGFKCMPWSDDGSGSWNSVRCSPVAEDPKRVGEPCTVFGGGASGLDDCELGAMCWDVDSDTEMGHCVAQCLGAEQAPICADPCTSCFISGSGVLHLCLPECDPLVQDCPRGQVCQHAGDSFRCVPDHGAEQGSIGDGCSYADCEPWLFCASADVVPGCETDNCCAPLCDVTAPDECDARLPGTVCTPWYPEGMSPKACDAGPGEVGACILAG